MIMIDGYSIEYEQNSNRIVITLPQTMQTANSTTAMVANRKLELNSSELIVILNVAKTIVEGGEVG